MQLAHKAVQREISALLEQSRVWDARRLRQCAGNFVNAPYPQQTTPIACRRTAGDDKAKTKFSGEHYGDNPSRNYLSGGQ
jgi:hypothetical protein